MAMAIAIRSDTTSYSQIVIEPALIPGKFGKVPQFMRQEDRSGRAYDPQVVSIGPYHYGKRELQLGEEAKQSIFQRFVEGSKKTKDFFRGKVHEQILYAKDCYNVEALGSMANKTFVDIMVLDSCFLIYLIYMGTITSASQATDHDYLPVFNRFGALANSLMLRDVYLMENQIPFKILMLMIIARYENGEDLVYKFLQLAAWEKFDGQQHQHIKQLLIDNPPLHLLDALRMVLVSDMTRKSLVPQVQGYLDEKGNFDMLKYHKTFCSAKDLKAKGIHFRPSSGKSLKAISFDSFTLYGKLQLPTTRVRHLTKVIFLNMIAYELSPSTLVDTTVISYIDFMKSLIVSPADVKELREKKILFTSWTDEDVVSFYKDLNTYEAGSTEGEDYRKVKQKIQEHYDSMERTWIAQLINTYFNSPWSIIAWLAGFVLLVLTFVQTCYTVKPKS